MFIVNGLINFLPHLFFILVIIFFTRYIIRVIEDISEDIEVDKFVLKGFPKDWAAPTRKLVSVIIWALAIVMIFPHIPGSSSPAFKGVSIFIGVLFSLGSTSAVANIVAGIVITYMRAYQIGDRVQIGETTGDVVDKTLLVTKIRTIKNIEVSIPNAMIINDQMTNYTNNAKEKGIILNTIVSIGYDVKWDLAEKLLLRAARKTRLLQKDPKPFVLQTSLDDSYVSYEINVYTKQAAKMSFIYSELNKNILNVFDDAGIEILSPKYVASRDGNMSTVPSQKGIDLRNPIEKILDQVQGKNQKVTIKKVSKKKETEDSVTEETSSKKES
jgi:small-conductance mechanosensitive channel